jgi:hypothetical protein
MTSRMDRPQEGGGDCYGVIVWGGPGAVLAQRLSEDPERRVLLLGML